VSSARLPKHYAQAQHTGEMWYSSSLF